MMTLTLNMEFTFYETTVRLGLRLLLYMCETTIKHQIHTELQGLSLNNCRLCSLAITGGC